jgi:hypothetical protein
MQRRNDKCIENFDWNNTREKNVAGDLYLVKIFFTCQAGIFFDS